MVKIQINFTNKWLYTFVLIVAIVALGIGVYATSHPNPGHTAWDIGEGTIGQVLTVSGGNVGIGLGATSPIHQLEVRGDVLAGDNLYVGFHNFNDKLYIESFSPSNPFANIVAGRADNNVGVGIRFDYRTDFGVATTGMVLDSQGRVGIGGTMTPRSTLDVIGDIQTTGNVIMGYEIVRNMAIDNFIIASCPSGKKAIGGGCNRLGCPFDPITAAHFVSSSSTEFTPVPGDDAYLCRWSGSDCNREAQVVCANIR